MTLNDIEFFTDELSRKTDALISERNMLRSELERFSESHIGRDKAFVNSIRDNVQNSEIYNEQIFKFIHFLMVK